MSEQMTQPLTPREKVELKPCPLCGGSPEMKFSEFELHDGFHVVCVGKKNCPLYCSQPYRAHDTEKEAAEVWNRRTAIASGSGDHAGLRRLADEAADFDVSAQVHPAVLNALLAENAALRVDLSRKHDACQIAQDQAMENGFRATQAERQRDEAVGLVGQIVGDAFGCNEDSCLVSHRLIGEARTLLASMEPKT